MVPLKFELYTTVERLSYEKKKWYDIWYSVNIHLKDSCGHIFLKIKWLI